MLFLFLAILLFFHRNDGFNSPLVHNVDIPRRNLPSRTISFPDKLGESYPGSESACNSHPIDGVSNSSHSSHVAFQRKVGSTCYGVCAFNVDVRAYLPNDGDAVCVHMQRIGKIGRAHV